MVYEIDGVLALLTVHWVWRTTWSWSTAALPIFNLQYGPVWLSVLTCSAHGVKYVRMYCSKHTRKGLNNDSPLHSKSLMDDNGAECQCSLIHIKHR